MKRLPFIFTLNTLLLLPLLSFGQIQKGALISSLGFGYQHIRSNVSITVDSIQSTTPNPTISIRSLTPSLSYMLTPNIGIGAGAVLMNIRQQVNDSSWDRTRGFGGSLFLSYYHPVNKQFYLTAMLGGELVRWSGKSQFGATVYEGPVVRQLAVGLRPGISYMPLRNLAFDLSFVLMSYSSSRQKTDGPSFTHVYKEERFYFGMEMNGLTIGVRYLFNNKPAE